MSSSSRGSTPFDDLVPPEGPVLAYEDFDRLVNLLTDALRDFSPSDRQRARTVAYANSDMSNINNFLLLMAAAIPLFGSIHASPTYGVAAMAAIKENDLRKAYSAIAEFCI
jgi:hypothetical protein